MEALILTPGMAPLSRSIEDYPEGIIIPIDKPYRWTSADVIRKIKYTAIRHFGKKNLKVGHAGTLDPLATGVLLVCIGKATKLAEELQSHDKEYVAGITFGATTPSYDLEKDIDRFFPHEHITASSVEDALPAFIGEQDQIAPLFSAKSVDGVRAYELARKLHREGKTLDEAAAELIRVSRINITELECIEFIGASAASEDPRTVPAALIHPLAGGGMSSPSSDNLPVHQESDYAYSWNPVVNFVPLRGDFARGIFASVYTRAVEGVSEEDYRKIFEDYYAESPFVFHSAEGISMKEVVNTNKGLVHVEVHDGYVHIASAIDNLVKGAAGQAVQNMNLMFGLPEDTGLRLKPSAF